MPTAARSALCLGLLCAVIAVASLNGMFFSPLFDPIFFHVGPLAESLFIPSSPLRLYFTSLLISFLTLALAGVPAALYERARGHTTSTPVSLTIWLVFAVLLTSPAWRAVMSPD